MPDSEFEREYLTSAEVARILRVSRETVQQYTRDGRLVGIKVGRQKLYKRADLQAYMDKRRG